MRYWLIGAFVVGALAGNLRAELKSVEYTFNNETNNGSGVWVPTSDPWILDNFGGSLFVGNKWSASKYIAFTASGAQFHGIASIANTFGTPSSDSVFSLEFSFYSETYWGTSAGVGNAASDGISLGGSVHSQGLFLQLGTTALGSAAYTFGANSWYDLRLQVDLSADSGNGLASVYIRPTGSSSWTSLASLSGIKLDLTTRNIDPTTWNTLWFHEEGASSGIDNVALVAESVPEPGTWGILALGGLLISGNAWRKRRVAGF